MAQLISPIATISTRKFGTRVTLLIGVFFETLALIGASFAKETWHLFLSQGICFGWGMGLLFTGSVGVIPQWFTTRRSFANGVATSGTGIGGLIYSLATGAIIQNIGVGWAYRILGICAFSVNLMSALLVRDRNKQASSIPGSPNLCQSNSDLDWKLPTCFRLHAAQTQRVPATPRLWYPEYPRIRCAALFAAKLCDFDRPHCAPGIDRKRHSELGSGSRPPTHRLLQRFIRPIEHGSTHDLSCRPLLIGYLDKRLVLRRSHSLCARGRYGRWSLLVYCGTSDHRGHRLIEPAISAMHHLAIPCYSNDIFRSDCPPNCGIKRRLPRHPTFRWLHVYGSCNAHVDTAGLEDWTFGASNRKDGGDTTQKLCREVVRHRKSMIKGRKDVDEGIKNDQVTKNCMRSLLQKDCL